MLDYGSDILELPPVPPIRRAPTGERTSPPLKRADSRRTQTHPEMNRSSRVRSVTLDGRVLDEPVIPLVDDGGGHDVEVVLGEGEALPPTHG